MVTLSADNGFSMSPVVPQHNSDNRNSSSSSCDNINDAAASWTDSIGISTAESMNASKRCTMEDVWVVDKDFGDRNAGGTILVGVYDGHGGREMVEYLRYGLSYHLAQEWFVVDETVSKQQRLERAFLMADLHAHELGISSSGAAVALCLIEQQQNDNSGCFYSITTANVGDSRIVLGQCGSHTKNDNSSNSATAPVIVCRLTTDHRGDNPLEKARIEQTGGFVFKKRVNGILAVTRSLGDFILKAHVIAHPTVHEARIRTTTNTNTAAAAVHDDNHTLQFLIVACDGLWDVLTDEEAVELVRAAVRNQVTTQTQVAQYLVDEALRRGTCDNVTAIVVWLQ